MKESKLVAKYVESGSLTQASLYAYPDSKTKHNARHAGMDALKRPAVQKRLDEARQLLDYKAAASRLMYLSQNAKSETVQFQACNKVLELWGLLGNRGYHNQSELLNQSGLVDQQNPVTQINIDLRSIDGSVKRFLLACMKEHGQGPTQEEFEIVFKRAPSEDEALLLAGLTGEKQVES